MTETHELNSSPHPVLGSLLLAGILVLALGLRAYNLDRVSFWGDEAHTVRRGSNFPSVVVHWRCAPLYFFSFVSLIFGEGETAVRLPHALAGMLSVYLLYRIGSAHIGARAALLAALLLALSTFHVHKSRDARYYSFMVLFTLLSLYALERALKERKIAWFIAFVVVSVANIHNHPFAVIPSGAFCVYGAWVWRRARRGEEALEATPRAGTGAEGTALSPGPAGTPAAPSNITRRAAAVWGGLLLVACVSAVYFFRPALWQALLERIQGVGSSQFNLELNLEFLERALIWFGAGPGFALALYVSCFAIGAILLALRRRRTFILAATFFVLTYLALCIAIWIGPSHAFHLRYLVYLLPFFLLVVAAGADLAVGWLFAAAWGAVRGRPPAPGSALAWVTPLVVSAAVFAGVCAPTLARYYQSQLADYRGAVALLLERAQPGDAIAMPAYRVMGHATAVRLYLKRARPDAEGLLIVSTPEELAALASRHGRVWLLEVVPADFSNGSAAVSAWAREHLTTIARIPNCVWNARLEAPLVIDELVIHGLP